MTQHQLEEHTAEDTAIMRGLFTVIGVFIVYTALLAAVVVQLAG